MRPVNQFNLSIPTAVHLHKSMYSVVPLYNTLTKVATKSWVSTGSIWNQSQTIFYCVKKSCSSLKWKIKKLYIRWTPLEKIVLIGWQTITILHHKHLQAQLLDSDIWVRQHHTLTSEDDFCWLPFFIVCLTTILGSIVCTYGIHLYESTAFYSSRPLEIFLGHLSNSGDLLLWLGVCRHPSCVNIFFSNTTGPILTKFGM